MQKIHMYEMKGSSALLFSHHVRRLWMVRGSGLGFDCDTLPPLNLKPQL